MARDVSLRYAGYQTAQWCCGLWDRGLAPGFRELVFYLGKRIVMGIL